MLGSTRTWSKLVRLFERSSVEEFLIHTLYTIAFVWPVLKLRGRHWHLYSLPGCAPKLSPGKWHMSPVGTALQCIAINNRDIPTVWTRFTGLLSCFPCVGPASCISTETTRGGSCVHLPVVCSQPEAPYSCSVLSHCLTYLTAGSGYLNAQTQEHLDTQLL